MGASAADGNGKRVLLRQVLACLAVVVLVTGLFAVVRMAENRAVLRHVDPLDQRVLQHLKTAAAEHPDDEALKDAFREVDRMARERFERAQAFGRTGAVVLAVCGALLAACLWAVASLSERRVLPGRTVAEEDPTGVLIRRGLLAGGITILVFAVVVGRRDPLDARATTGGDAAASRQESQPEPAFDAAPEQWAAFRGCGGHASTAAAPVPLRWNGTTGENILWHVTPPRPGFSSPILWHGRLYLTGADAESRELYCFDAENGSLLWTAPASDIVGSPAKLPKVTEDTGYAAPTPVTDGKRIVAIFATGDVLCVDPAGKRLWARNLGLPDNPYGHSSSPLLHRGMVLVQYDHFAAARFLALSAETGETLWETVREVGASWASPVLVRAGSRVLAVLNAEPFVEAFDVETGSRAWSCECMGGEVGPSPAVSGELAFATTDYAVLAAIRLAGEGAGTVVWETDEELPDVASPVAWNDLLFVVTSAGIVSCYQASSGHMHWRQDVEVGSYASPVVAEGRLYVPDRKGVTRVITAGPTFTLLATNPLGEPIVSTPAPSAGRLYLRGVKQLYCIGQ
ncbi:MAG: PQQ-binding-like beta-propeller repeat protein [Lentisphaeria bacterium]|nr:PQQ-binding-like beta-propeller repeat protein [Lentisphaeria bacterium]